MKRCPRCDQFKPLTDFHKDASKPDGLNVWCINCHKTVRKVRESNPDARFLKKMKRWEWGLKTRYGITVDEYNRMLDEQDGLCAICEEFQEDKFMAVDHCHETGRVRGLLCSYCNLMLGNAKDNMLTLQRGINYLKERG